jgi:phage host-nuclease inhibitor protein Gam
MKTLAAYHASRYKPTDAQLKTALVQNQKALDEFRAAHEDEIGNVGILRKVEMWCGWRRPDPKPPELP